MSITVTCGCGKQFHVKDEHAGKRTTCPICKQPLHIPAKSTAVSQAVPLPVPVPALPQALPVSGPVVDQSTPSEVTRQKTFSPKVVLVLAGVCVVLILLIVVVVVIVSGSRSPSEVVKATFLNANQGRYSDANNGLSSHMLAVQDQTGMAKQLWDGVTRKGSITKVEILKEEVRGEGATVRFKIHYKDGSSFESEEDLVKEGGSWKIASNNYLVRGLVGQDNAPKREIQPVRLAATITWTDAETRQVGLLHGGIPGSLVAGSHRFSLAADTPWPNVSVGQKVECLMEPRNGQWVVADLKLAQRAAAKAQPDQPQAAKKQPSDEVFDAANIWNFLAISSDFEACAISATKGSYHYVKVVDTKTGKALNSPNFHLVASNPRAAAFGKDVIAVVISDSVRIFSRRTGELEQVVHGNGFDRAAFTADGRFLATIGFLGGQGYKLMLRDIQRKKTIEVDLGSKANWFLAVEGNHVVVHDQFDERIIVVEAATAKSVKQLDLGILRKTKEFGPHRRAVAISPAGDLLVCEAQDDIVLYDIASGKVARKLAGHLDTVRAVAFSPNGQMVASAAKDNTIRFWNVKDGKEIHIIKNLRESPSDLIFSADGSRVAVVYHGDSSLTSRKAEIRTVEPK